ncbi:MAG: 16S rRNA (guanine(527)-N(7))-methyltransferase RsmG [Desulfobacteraceae bacterium]|nr:16S rRNA (guanine(527)-N(7))-methyltransferase RsmG [Desulfobacteraceae bacterium]
MNTAKTLFFNDKWKNTVRDGCKSFKISLSEHQIDLFATHAAHLNMWNKSINLTAIKDPDEIALKHFIDSIALMPHIPKHARILDIGSGGGFPGFCLKIANPQLDIVMIDSAKKKVNFLKDLIRTTGMKKIEAKHIRAEELANDILYKGKFDIVVSRAFSNLHKFYRLSEPFLNNNGIILAMKGQHPIDEIKELKELDEIKDSNRHIKSYSYLLPFQNIERSIIKIS